MFTYASQAEYDSEYGFDDNNKKKNSRMNTNMPRKNKDKKTHIDFIHMVGSMFCVRPIVSAAVAAATQREMGKT